LDSYSNFEKINFEKYGKNQQWDITVVAWGSRGEAPSGFQGQSPGGGVGAEPPTQN